MRMNVRELIEQLGGSTKVAAMLGLTKPGSVQRVNNWKVRGIPPSVKVQRPDLFMPGLVVQAGAQQHADAQPGTPCAAS